MNGHLHLLPLPGVYLPTVSSLLWWTGKPLELWVSKNHSSLCCFCWESCHSYDILTNTCPMNAANHSHIANYTVIGPSGSVCSMWLLFSLVPIEETQFCFVSTKPFLFLSPVYEPCGSVTCVSSLPPPCQSGEVHLLPISGPRIETRQKGSKSQGDMGKE